MEFDSTLQEEYTQSSLFSIQSDNIIRQKSTLDTTEYDLQNPDILNQLQQFGISFDNQELEYYKTLYQNINRKPNIIELFDPETIKTEHSRHWFFNGEYLR